MHIETHETENKEAIKAPVRGGRLIVAPSDQEEHAHLIEERLGIMCGDGKPSERQIQIAKIEADAWAAKQRKAKVE